MTELKGVAKVSSDEDKDLGHASLSDNHILRVYKRVLAEANSHYSRIKADTGPGGTSTTDERVNSASNIFVPNGE